MAAGSLVGPRPGIMVEITGLRHPDDGEEEEIGLGLSHGKKCHFKLRTVNGVTGLEAYDPVPAELCVDSAQFQRCDSLLPEIEMQRQAHHFQSPAQVAFSSPIKQIANTGMTPVKGPVNLPGLFFAFNGPDIFDVQDGQEKSFRVPEANGLACFQMSRQRFRNIQTDGDGPDPVILQTHPVQHAFVIRLVQKALQW